MIKNAAYLLIFTGAIFYSAFGSTSLVTAEDPPTADSNSVKIDFGSCVSGERIRIDTNFGSTTYQIVGLVEDGCVMRYGGEMENPAWDGFLDKLCTVPSSLGVQSFKKGDAGIDLSEIDEYCVETQRPVVE